MLEKTYKFETKMVGGAVKSKKSKIFYVDIQKELEYFLNHEKILPYVEFPTPLNSNTFSSFSHSSVYAQNFRKYNEYIAVSVWIDDVSCNTPIGVFASKVIFPI